MVDSAGEITNYEELLRQAWQEYYAIGEQYNAAVAAGGYTEE
jgi:hypothetical protein